MPKIDSKTKRAKLPTRREPYWEKLEKGGYIGFRRTEDGGTWIARWRHVDGKQKYTTFGSLDAISHTDQYDEASKLARNWFKSFGVASKSGYTVGNAVEDYCRHLEIEKGPKAASDARQRLNKHVLPTLGDIQLNKLTLKQVQAWRKSLVRKSDDPEDVRKSKDTANRNLSILKAALNLAYYDDIVGTDAAWRRVKAFEDVGTARKIILDDKQIRSLMEKASGGFRDLCRSGLLTGARYGELIQAKVRDFDPKEGTIHLDGKTGPRTTFLNDDAVAHFKQLSKGKLPKAYLHTRDDGTPWARSHQQRPMQDAVRAAKLPAETTFYALRHTHISRALLAGVNVQVVAENCGTSVRMIEKHYGKFLNADRRAMFNQVSLG